MLVGCGYKDELKYVDSTNVLVANLKPLIWVLWVRWQHYGHIGSGFKLATSTFVLSILEFTLI